MSPRGPLTELALVYAGVLAATALFTHLDAFPIAKDYAHLLVGGTFLIAALRLAQREPGGPRRYGIDLAGVLAPADDDEGLLRTVRAALPTALREAGWALVVALVVFPPFVAGFFWYWGPTHPFTLRFAPDVVSFALAQAVVVGLPEEAFFRGYAQTRLGDAWPATTRVLGVPVSLPALFGQAALFAAVHLPAYLNPQDLATFFPGLLFGWIRAWRGGIGAAILFHAMCNLLSDTLMRSWGMLS